MCPHVDLFYFSYSEICKMFYSEFFKSEKLHGLISLLLSVLSYFGSINSSILELLILASLSLNVSSIFFIRYLTVLHSR